MDEMGPVWGETGTWGLTSQVFIVVLLALVLDFAQRKVLKRVHRRLVETDNPWDDALVDALAWPLSLLIWVVGITFAAQMMAEASGAPIFAAVGPLREIGVVAALTWFMLRVVRRVENNLVAGRERRGEPVDRTSVNAIGRLVRVSVLITALLVTLQTLGFSVSGVLAFGGVGGIAVGFAAKDLLANFFGGLMIYLDRPFSVGEWVRSPDRDIEGTVEEIGWRLTRIRSFDKRPLYIPNSAFANITVQNPSRMTHRRLYETVGIRYADFDKLPAITAQVKAMLQEHPAIDTTQTVMVSFDAFGPSSLNFFVCCFTHTTVWTEYHAVKEEVLLKVGRIIAAHGAEIAFPTTTVHLVDGRPVVPEAAGC
ncbi:MAG: mechanosensitive ion channel family protein [Nitrospirae bacterium]|nr:mechanosensitive ion channel family protein [Nitrospirota bacterium]